MPAVRPRLVPHANLTRLDLSGLTKTEKTARAKDNARRNMEARRRAFNRLAALYPTMAAALFQQARAEVDRERGPMIGDPVPVSARSGRTGR